MYELLKKGARGFIPFPWLLKNETLIRRIIALFYWGRKFQCNICEQKLSKFQLKKNKDKMCPACGSLPRNRRLWSLVAPLVKPNSDILHFSPSRSLSAKFNSLKNIRYISTDFEDEFPALKHHDITSIDEPDFSFDLILCYHVLEHIEQDKKAMEELFRILKKGGHCFIQTPFQTGEIYENPEVSSPEDRKLHFGQEDHVRIYSVEGLEKRLQQAGFKTTIKSFTPDPDDFNGFKREELIIATKV